MLCRSTMTKCISLGVGMPISKNNCMQVQNGYGIYFVDFVDQREKERGSQGERRVLEREHRQTQHPDYVRRVLCQQCPHPTQLYLRSENRHQQTSLPLSFHINDPRLYFHNHYIIRINNKIDQAVLAASETRIIVLVRMPKERMSEEWAQSISYIRQIKK